MGRKSVGEYENESRRSVVTAGIVFIVFGVLMGFAVGFSTGAVSGVIAFVIFEAVGVFLLCFKDIEKKIRERNDTPGTEEYANKQTAMDVRRKQIYEKAVHHSSLRSETSMKIIGISGIILGAVVVCNIVMLVSGSVSVLMLVLLALAAVMFVLSLFGKDYKRTIAAFARYGVDEKQAAEIYKNMHVYKAGDMIAVGDRFLMPGSTADIIPVKRIVWVFPKLKWIYNYTNGIYSGRTNEYSILFCQSNGDIHDMKVDEAAIPLIIEDMRRCRPGVVCGYDEKLSQLYNSDPRGFEEAEKTVPQDPCAMLMPSFDSRG
ncbi:MAG: hypothetical protein J6M90_05405 [Oscillospiraceae bacterium]|nr:hypothetical protein [Oscillospiraceae bacterium]